MPRPSLPHYMSDSYWRMLRRDFPRAASQTDGVTNMHPTHYRTTDNVQLGPIYVGMTYNLHYRPNGPTGKLPWEMWVSVTIDNHEIGEWQNIHIADYAYASDALTSNGHTVDDWQVI